MKLILKQDRAECEIFPRNVFLSYGKCTWGLAKKPDGYYIRIEFPFIANRSYYNPNTFEPMVGPCRFVFAIRRRKNSYTRFIKMWTPVE